MSKKRSMKDVRESFTEEDRKRLMAKYLEMKSIGDKTEVEIAEELGVSTRTLFNWRNEPFYEEVKEQMLYQRNAVISTSALDRLNELIKSEEEDVSLRALNVFARLNDDIELNRRPSGEGANKDKLLDSELFLRMRRGG